MSNVARLSVSEALRQLGRSIGHLPQLLLIRYVRAVALLLLIVVLLGGALAVIALLFTQSIPEAGPDQPATILSLDKLPPIEQGLLQRRQQGQAGLSLESRTYFEAPAINP